MERMMYHGEEFEGAMSLARNYHAWIMDIMRPYLHGRVAEVGAGSGNLTALLLKEDIERIVAIEPSEDIFPLLKGKYAKNPKVECIHDYFSETCDRNREGFDTVIYVNVLEHVRDDSRELSLIHQSLRKGGHVCIFVPALPWLYSDFEATVGHHRRYYKSQLRSLMEQAGFEVTKIHYFDSLGVIPWFIFFKLFKGKLNPKNAALYDKTAIPVLRIIETLIPPPVGKNLIAIGKKIR